MNGAHEVGFGDLEVEVFAGFLAPRVHAEVRVADRVDRQRIRNRRCAAARSWPAASRPQRFS
jgi:hypothetical protein